MKFNFDNHTPHLTTALVGPLQLLENTLLEEQQKIEEWFLRQWKLSPAPIYGSVDLRNSGFKLAPVDMNLFPGGFNNLNPDFLPLSIEAARAAIRARVSDAKKIILIPEGHTRNIRYWDNVKALLDILESAGFDVRVGAFSEIFLSENIALKVHLLKRENNRIGIDNFNPDIILLNNDLSEGIPEILQNVIQPVMPPAELGWSQRLKSNHFQFYAKVSQEFANLIAIDPWFIAPLFKHCGEIDFMKREGEDCLVNHIEKLFSEIEQKYAEYAISNKPFVIVKADAGTYGMAVMTVRSVDEARELNRKQRTSMAKTKGGKPVHRVIVQEGVYTYETVGAENSVAEPVVYLWGERVVGGFYRVHKERGVDENLNAPGMQFEPLAFAEPCLPNRIAKEAQNRFYTYGVIARLSMLAAAREGM